MRGEGGLAAGLYMVATPIGNARDITLRALDVLAAADVLAAEDTRAARRLMEIHGIALKGRPLIAYHDHNGPAQRPRLLRHLAEGAALACLSEAGTPLVADPGYDLVRAAIAAGHPVTAVPGASALLAALCVAGLPTDRFMFAGFPPARKAARRRFLAGLAGVPATLVFCESPRRVAESLADMAAIFGPERPAALCRELTKRFEEVRRARLGDLVKELFSEQVLRGEIVLVLGPPGPAASDEDAVAAALREALQSMSLREAVREVVARTGAPRRRVYAMALEIAGR
ncbi:MAG: 16S rRNA (cytidine(1402)-2'-O)-methyltransferase [Alphaproteobacteria bacterium]|nr:MAG: 16S rRNA (cytidine(1402)-2'-O)-methyltransferase [Alphaproteobacteria bacterium]